MVLVGGCSVALVTGPPVHPTGPFECTDSRVPPYLDVGIASALLLGGIAGIAAQNNCDPSQQDCLASNVGVGAAHDIGAVALLSAVVFGLSAVHGFSETSACRRAR